MSGCWANEINKDDDGKMTKDKNPFSIGQQPYNKNKLLSFKVLCLAVIQINCCADPIYKRTQKILQFCEGEGNGGLSLK